MGKLSDAAFGDDLFRQSQPRDRTQARDARDEGMARVLSKNEAWRDAALTEMGKLFRGWIGTAEDIRINITPKVGSPTHPNAWGGLMNAAIRRGWFAPTGKWIAPADVKSHSRPTREYIRT